MATTVHTVLFPRDRWTIEGAKSWLIEHDFKKTNVVIMPNFYRFRQIPPSKFAQETFRTISISAAEGIEFIIGVLKKDMKKPRA